MDTIGTPWMWAGCFVFALADVAARFHLLSCGLALVLLFIGAKMLLLDVVKIPALVALGVAVPLIAASGIASLLRSQHDEVGALRAALAPREAAR